MPPTRKSKFNHAYRSLRLLGAGLEPTRDSPPKKRSKSGSKEPENRQKSFTELELPAKKIITLMAATACSTSSSTQSTLVFSESTVHVIIDAPPDARHLNLAKLNTEHWADVLTRVFTTLPRLESLDLSYTAITDRELIALKQQLRTRQGFVKLILNECSQITGDEIICVLNTCRLQHLSLDGNAQLNENDLLGIVRRSRSLRYLSLAGLPHVTDLILREIAQGCPELRELNLSHCSNITNVGVTEIRTRCLHLQRLDVAGSAAATAPVPLPSTDSKKQS